MRACWLVLVAMVLASAPAAAATWSKSYAVGAAAALELHTDDASVRVIAWSEPRFQIDVEADGWKIGEGGLRLTESQSGDGVRFALDEPVFQMHFGISRRWVRVTVHAPEKAALTLDTGDGNVTCDGVHGRVHVDTGDGDITVSNLAGDVDLRTGDGRVDARQLEGSLAVRSGDGGLRLRGRFDALDVSTNDGSVTIDVAPGSRVASPWHIRTGDGPVVLRLPSDLETTLNASTGDGGIAIELPMTIVGRLHENQLRADLHGGGPELKLKTGDGSILVEPYSQEAEQSSSWNSSDSGHHHKVHKVSHP